MLGGEKELWEDLNVVWQDGSGRWVLSTVINHHASADQSAPRHVSHSEIVSSYISRDDTRVFGHVSFEEAMLRAAVLARGRLWQIKDGRCVYVGDPPIDKFELVPCEAL